MEYIGATGVPVSFDEVPMDPNINFYFLLSFAIDADYSGNTQNGKFSPYWASDLTPQSFQSIKARHRNVKVLVSLAGWSIGENVITWYKPESTQAWITNAYSSLKSIIIEFHLDGIYIDYENFPKKDTTFAYCIGELITKLKKDRVITIASVAPYYLTVDPYHMLFQKYGAVIDYVNYQFYTDKVRVPAGYLKAFRQRASQFDAAKLLPSYEVDGRGIQGDAFFDALNLLKSRGFAINGVMIFSAVASQKDGFYFEKKSQEFLLNSTKTARSAQVDLELVICEAQWQMIYMLGGVGNLEMVASSYMSNHCHVLLS